MASVYPEIHGEQIERLVARHVQVQTELVEKAGTIAAKAMGLLAAHHKTGATQITMGRGDIDMYVYLENPPDASWSAYDIEYGHFLGKREAGKERPWVDGLWILHDAAGLPHTARG